MQQTEQKFKELFQKEPIKSIDFYNVDEKYLSLDEEHEWVIRGGIEFIFESFIISWGWNNAMHLNELIEGDLDDLLGDLDVYELEIGELPVFEKINGQKVNNINFKWTFYQELDEEMELSDAKTYIPQEINFKFENGTTMQISTVIFQIKADKMHAPSYDPQGAFLVMVNKEAEIAEMEEE